MDINYAKFARLLLASYIKIHDAERPIDSKVARAEFMGICKAADRLDLPNATTPAAVEMALQDAIEHVMAHRGPRPHFRAMSNNPQKEWDQEVEVGLCLKMQWGTELD